MYLAAVIVGQLAAFGSPLAKWSLGAAGVRFGRRAATLASVPRHGFVRSVLAAPLLAVSHVFYGLGFWRGLFTRLHRGSGGPQVEVFLENVAR